MLNIQPKIITNNYYSKPRIVDNKDSQPFNQEGLLSCPKPYYISFGKTEEIKDKFSDCPNPKLTRLMSKYVFESPMEIRVVANKSDSKFKNIAGDIPPEWADEIKTPEEKEQIFNAFKKFSAETRLNYTKNTYHPGADWYFCSNSMLEREEPLFLEKEKFDISNLSNALKKINKGQNIKFERNFEGERGLVYLMNIDGKEYALKIFRNNANYEQNHGNLSEPNRALFMKNNYPTANSPEPVKQPFIHMFFSDIDEGYMFSEHSDDAEKRAGKEYKNKDELMADINNFRQELHNKLGLKYNESIGCGNFIENIFVDYGGLTALSDCPYVYRGQDN